MYIHVFIKYIIFISHFWRATIIPIPKKSSKLILNSVEREGFTHAKVFILFTNYYNSNIVYVITFHSYHAGKNEDVKLSSWFSTVYEWIIFLQLSDACVYLKPDRFLLFLIKLFYQLIYYNCTSKKKFNVSCSLT